MDRIKFLSAVFFIIILLLTVSHALTLKEAKKIALKKNLQLQASKKSLQASKWKTLKRYSQFLPSGNANVNYTNYLLPYASSFGGSMPSGMPTTSGLEPSEENLSYSLEVSQPIFNGGKLFWGARLQSDALKMARENHFSSKLNTIANVEKKYFSILEQKDLLRISQKNKTIAEQNLEIAEIRYEKGTLSKAEYLKMKSDAISKRVELINTRNLYRTSKADLANYLQLQREFKVEGLTIEKYKPLINKMAELKPEQQDSFVRWCISEGTDKSPAIQIAELSKMMSKKTSWMALGNFLPSLNLNYRHNWSEDQYNNNEFNENESYALMISMPISPLVNNFSEWRKSKNEYRKSLYNFWKTKDNMELTIRRAALKFISKAKSVESSKLSLKYAKQSYEKMQKRFKKGLISTTDILNSEVMYISAEMNYTKSYYSFLKAKTQLKKAMGLKDDNNIRSYIISK